MSLPNYTHLCRVGITSPDQLHKLQADFFYISCFKNDLPLVWRGLANPTTQTTSIFEADNPDSEHLPILTTETTSRFFLHIEFQKWSGSSLETVSLPNYTNYIWFRISLSRFRLLTYTNYINYKQIFFTYRVSKRFSFSSESESIPNYTNYT